LTWGPKYDILQTLISSVAGTPAEEHLRE
jgi:hypothetical protein